ncbi:hypothetical protein [Halalkalicoccus salilacus]
MDGVDALYLLARDGRVGVDEHPHRRRCRSCSRARCSRRWAFR